jgi:hypothetical protein
VTITDIYEIEARVQDAASSALEDVRASMASAGGAGEYLLGILGKTSEELGKGQDNSTQYSAEVRELAAAWSISAEQLDKLNRQVRENPYDEAGQKLLDVRNRLDEYGASAEQQAAALGLLARTATTSTLPLSKQALVLEELVIEFQDADRALGFFEEGLKLVEQRGGRAEDAIADLTAAAKGDTGGLSRLGPVARAAAEGLDQIRDPALRAERTLATFRREAARVPDELDRANDQIALAKVRLAELSARLGPVGQIAGVAAAGLLALGGGALALATDATLSYVESNRGAKDSLEETKGAVSRLEREFGRLIAQAVDLDNVLLGVGGSARQLTNVIVAVDRETLGFRETLDAVSEVTDLVGGRVTVLGSVFGQVGGVVGDLGVGLGGLAFDLVAEQEERTRKASEDLRREIQNQGDEWDRLNSFLLEGDEYTRNLISSQEELTRSLRVGKVDDFEALTLSSRGRAFDQPRQGPLLPTGGFDANVVDPAAQAREERKRKGEAAARAQEQEEARIARLEILLFRAQQEELERRARERIAEWGRIGTAYGEELVFGLGAALRDQGKQALNELAGTQAERRLGDLRRALGEFDQPLFIDLEVPDLSGVEDFARAIQLLDAEAFAQVVADIKTLRLDAEELAQLEIDLASPSGIERLRQMADEADRLNSSLGNIATQGLASAITGLAQLGASLAVGETKLEQLGDAFLGILGGVLTQAGQGFLLLGLGTQAIQSGISNPLALVGIGTLAIAAGAVLTSSATAQIRGGGAGKSPEAATRDAFRESTDRLLQDQKREREAINVFVTIGGEQLDPQIEQSARRLSRNGLLGALVGV